MSQYEMTFRDMIDKKTEVLGILRGVQDAGSARASIRELNEKFQKLADDHKALLQNKTTGSVSTRTGDKLAKQWLTVSKQMDNEMERLRIIRGLPPEFWKIVSLQVLEMQIVAADAMQTHPDSSEFDHASLPTLYKWRELCKQNGFEGVVQLDFTNLTPELSQKAYDKLQKAAPGAQVLSLDPRVNFEKTSRIALGPARDYKAVLKSVDFGTVTFEDEGQRVIQVTVDRRKLGALGNTDEEERELKWKADQEKRDREMEEARARAASNFPDMSERTSIPNSSDPDYYDKLADIMATGEHFAKEKAIDALLNATPTEVSSPETRKKIAKNFKKLAESDSTFDKKKAIKGLVIWGGQFSVPILLKMLDDSHHFEQIEIMKALGDLKDPQAAEALASRLGDFSTHDVAFAALKQLGSGAEDALLDVAPSEDPKICLAAITLLGNSGTEKSLEFLRQAQSASRNSDVRAAAKIATKKIIARKNKEKASK
jgi:HEAT repeat protein